MSGRDSDVICGPFSLSWSSVVKVAEFLHKTALVNSTIARSHSYNAIIMQTCKEDPQPLGMLLQMPADSRQPIHGLFALYRITRNQKVVLKHTVSPVDIIYI